MINIKNFEQNDWDHLHDCIYNVTGSKSSRKDLERMFGLMPEELQIEASQWGMNDTVWRDNFIEWMKSKI